MRSLKSCLVVVLVASVALRGATAYDPTASDEFGPLRFDDKNRIRSDLVPMSCDDKYNEQGFVYGPDNYGCKNPSGYTLKLRKGDRFSTIDGNRIHDGTLRSCQVLASASKYDDNPDPHPGCFNSCYITINKDGTCFFYDDCGRLGYTKGDLTNLDCRMT